MHLDERIEGPYRIYAGALEARQGDGYIAAVVVKLVEGGTHRGREAYRDDSLACGYRWASPDEALKYALARAREVIARQMGKAAC